MKEIKCKIEKSQAVDYATIYDIEFLESMNGVNHMRFDPSVGIVQVTYDVDPTDTNSDEGQLV